MKKKEIVMITLVVVLVVLVCYVAVVYYFYYQDMKKIPKNCFNNFTVNIPKNYGDLNNWSEKDPIFQYVNDTLHKKTN